MTVSRKFVLEFHRGLLGVLDEVVVVVVDERTEPVGVADMVRGGPAYAPLSSRDPVMDLRGTLLERVLIGKPEYRLLGGNEDLELEVLAWRDFVPDGVTRP